jgi:hypothetical protein
MSPQSNYNICISQNNTSTQFFSDILEPLNYHYLDGTEKNPKYSKFHIFQKDPSLTKGFRQWSYPVSDARAVLEAHKGLVDCYVSTNESTFKRREADVNALTMLTCDADTYKDAPINLSCSRGKLQFSRHLQRHWTKSDRKIMYGELFRPVLRVKREPHPYP